MSAILNTIKFTAPISPPDTTTQWGSHYSKYGVGGLQEYDSKAQLEAIPVTRLLTGSIGYAKSENVYYMWIGTSWQPMSALTTGSPSFIGLTSSAGIYIQTGNLYLNGGNIQTSGTASFGSLTASNISVSGIANTYLPYSNNGVLAASYLAQTANALSSSVAFTASNFTTSGFVYSGGGFSSSIGYLRIGGVSNLGIITSSGISATLINASAGILITNGANISFSAGGNVATTGTASFSSVTASAGFNSSGTSQLGVLNLDTALTVANGGTGRSTLPNNQLLIGAGTAGINPITNINPGGVLISQGETVFPVFSNNLYLTGTASVGALTSSGLKSNGIISGSSTLNIVGAGTFGGDITLNGARSIIATGPLTLNGGGTSTAVQIYDGLLSIGVSGSANVGYITQSSGRIASPFGFCNAQSSFTVNDHGDLQCHSLKQTSLRAFKYDIMDIQDNQLNNIMRLQPVTFLYTDDAPQDINDKHVRQAGFIAQDVQKVYPQIAWYKDNELAGLQYQRMTAYLVKGMQQLYSILLQKEEQIDKLQSLVNELKFDLQQNYVRKQI